MTLVAQHEHPCAVLRAPRCGAGCGAVRGRAARRGNGRRCAFDLFAFLCRIETRSRQPPTPVATTRHTALGTDWHTPAAARHPGFFIRFASFRVRNS